MHKVTVFTDIKKKLPIGEVPKFTAFKPQLEFITQSKKQTTELKIILVAAVFNQIG